MFVRACASWATEDSGERQDDRKRVRQDRESRRTREGRARREAGESSKSIVGTLKGRLQNGDPQGTDELVSTFFIRADYRDP